MSFKQPLINILITLCLINKGLAAKYIFTKNYDVYDHQNWENHFPQPSCDGLVLPEWPMGVITSRELVLQQIVFGNHMSFLINDDTNLIFDEISESILNCVKLNSTEMVPHYWIDSSNWLRIDKQNNEAVPDLERLPGLYDEVIFPKGVTTGRVYITGNIRVKSLTFGSEVWSNDDYIESRKDSILSDILTEHSGNLFIADKSCDDVSGCQNGNEESYQDRCLFVEPKNVDCLEPIEAIGFCYPICGATIVFEPREGFSLAKLEEKLTEYKSDSYASKVRGGVVQVVFTEKVFTGDSLSEARNLFDALVREKIIEGPKSKFLSSGYYYKEGAVTRNTVSMIFTTLIGVIMIFTLIFVIFNNDKCINIRERFGLERSPLTYKSIFFSRNMSVSEGAELIDEDRSFIDLKNRHSDDESVENLPDDRNQNDGEFVDLSLK